MAILTNRRKQELSERITSSTTQHMMDSVTLGIVVDTNDPQQMGRARIMCARWGDSAAANIDTLPWAVYSTPFGGQVNNGTRGSGIQDSYGGIAYGMWAIPKVGAQVLVMCIDSDPNQRVYIGCVYDQFTPHTMPHGRFMYDDHPLLDNTITPSGPYTSREKPIEPLHANMRQAFGNKTNHNYEWQNRAADCTVTALDINNMLTTYSSVPDDKDVTKDGWTSTQGYQTNRQDPNTQSEYTPRNLDSMVYSFTSPGFHALSMDDRMENCRIRLRTTSGHQIIMDDTNERIYIATAKGENWIELDQAGNIDVFSSNKVNIRAVQGINLTTDDQIRMTAKKGVHIYTEDEFRVHALKDINVRTEQNIRTTAAQSIYTQAAQELHSKSGSTMHLTSAAQMNFASGADLVASASPNIHLNGPAAVQATAPNEKKAFWTSRVPTHEPFARTMTKDDYTHDPEFKYDDAHVNRVERGRTITRGLYWRR